MLHGPQRGRCLVALTLLAAAALPAAVGQGPAKPRPVADKGLLAGVKVMPGFEVTLFAAPPDVRYPTCVAATPTGELFVGIDENASLDRKPGRGSVVRCLDTDGDGKADKFTVFAKVESPRGLFHDGKTLFVLHPPDLSAYRDTDGDGVADEKVTLVKGIGYGIEHPRGADHTTNGIRMGIDGWLYVAVGDFGFKATAKDGKTLTFHGGGVARVRPDGTDLEIVSRGQRNIYDVAVDPLLNLFTRDNTNDGGGWDVRLSHVIPSGNYGYPSLFKNFAEETVKPLADLGGGSPTGALFADEPGLPPGFGHTLYTCEWGRNAVYRHPLEASGAGFKARQEPFLEMPRPTDIDIDGQGRFYVSSWRGGEYRFKGPDVGYVIRVTAKDAKPAPFPDLKRATAVQLLGHLAAPSHFLRLQAQREFLRREDRSNYAKELEKMASSGGPLGARVAALFTLRQACEAASLTPMMRLLRDDTLREFALRSLADCKGEIHATPARPLFDGLTDKNPRVRLRAAYEMGRCDWRAEGERIVPLTADEDPLVAHVAVNALVSLRAADACFKALDANPPKLAAGAGRVLQALHEPKVVEGLIARLESSRAPAVREVALAALCRLYFKEADWDGKWWGTKPDTRGPYFKPVKWAQSDRIAQVLGLVRARSDAATVRVLLREAGRNRVPLGDTAALTLELAAKDPAFRRDAVALLAGQSPLADDAVKLLADVAGSAKEDEALRARALRGLLAAAKQPAALEAAVRALTSGAAAGELGAVREEFARDTVHAQHVARFVELAEAGEAARRDLAWAVLMHVEGNRLSPKGAKESAAQAIREGWKKPEAASELLRAVARTFALQHAPQVESRLKDGRAEVRQSAAEAAREMGFVGGKMPPRVALKGQRYEDVTAAALKEKGAAKLGQHLFARQGCAACHTATANEPSRGPSLLDIAARYNRAELLESVLKPSAKLAQGFETLLFVMNDGTLHTGFIVRESGDEVEIRNAEGAATVLAKDDVDQRRRQDTSVMPEGLADDLTVRELASLIAYLESLRSR